MNKKIVIIFLACTICALNACCSRNEHGRVFTERWEFKNADGWGYSHQDTSTIKQWYIEGDSLILFTRANTYDRTKFHTIEKKYTFGDYTWRILIPEIAPGEQASIAGFIYNDDHHEIDFEIGYGKQEAREKCGAQEGDMIACMTNQDLPFISNNVPIKPGWHIFTIRLKDKDSNYMVEWLIDGKVCQSQELTFGDEFPFTIMCSVENLLFMGDFMPTHNNIAKFDYVTFEGNVKS